MQTPPSLRKFGDKTERQYWDRLQRFIPHYEVFWQTYVVPLREEDSIWFREDIDPLLETVAIASYSTFLALGRAHQQVYANREGFRHIEEVYMAIQRAAEVGLKLIDAFLKLQEKYSRSHPLKSRVALNDFIKIRLSKYRNLLHDAILPMPKEEKRRKIPKPDKIDNYRLWTRVMYHYNDDDFIVASDQAKDDFIATASRLEDAWKEMCALYESFQNRLGPSIFHVTQETAFEGSMIGGPPASGTIYLGSDAMPSKPSYRFAVRQKQPGGRKRR
jgi:hypothetical protein